MNPPTGEPQKPPMPRGQKIACGIAAALLLITAALPPGFALIPAGLAVLLLWPLLTMPLMNVMTESYESPLTKALFGLFAILLGALGTVLLVGLACALPLSRFKVG
ncbi:MAG: hypothetical protein HY293_13770 [Planctomycetes bacterium]|nr:hypothetical protein [Planctomycetota bacterium]